MSYSYCSQGERYGPLPNLVTDWHCCQTPTHQNHSGTVIGSVGVMIERRSRWGNTLYKTQPKVSVPGCSTPWQSTSLRVQYLQFENNTHKYFIKKEKRRKQLHLFFPWSPACSLKIYRTRIRTCSVCPPWAETGSGSLSLFFSAYTFSSYTGATQP